MQKNTESGQEISFSAHSLGEYWVRCEEELEQGRLN